MFIRPVRIIPSYLPKRFISTEVSKEAFLEHLEGGIAVLQLNRPASRNALSVRLVDEFRAALAEVRFSGYENQQSFLLVCVFIKMIIIATQEY